jgi:hypothetical protein
MPRGRRPPPPASPTRWRGPVAARRGPFGTTRAATTAHTMATAGTSANAPQGRSTVGRDRWTAHSSSATTALASNVRSLTRRRFSAAATTPPARPKHDRNRAGPSARTPAD